MRGVLVPSETTSHCPWKGEASYYSINADGKINEDAAWYYPAPKEAAEEIRDRIAFWKGVEVIELAAEERSKLVEKGNVFIGEWVEKANAVGLDGEALLETYRGLIDKYTEERDTKGYPWLRG